MIPTRPNTRLSAINGCTLKTAARAFSDAPRLANPNAVPARTEALLKRNSSPPPIRGRWREAPEGALRVGEACNLDLTPAAPADYKRPDKYRLAHHCFQESAHENRSEL